MNLQYIKNGAAIWTLLKLHCNILTTYFYRKSSVAIHGEGKQIRRLIYLFIYLFIIYLFIYLFIYLLNPTISLFH